MLAQVASISQLCLCSLAVFSIHLTPSYYNDKVSRRPCCVLAKEPTKLWARLRSSHIAFGFVVIKICANELASYCGDRPASINVFVIWRSLKQPFHENPFPEVDFYRASEMSTPQCLFVKSCLSEPFMNGSACNAASVRSGWSSNNWSSSLSVLHRHHRAPSPHHIISSKYSAHPV